MNYIQYMKPGSKFWALPNGLEDVSWSEFWNNWKEAIVKAKEQIADNWEDLKQDYKDAADPIAASERRQAESIEATKAKQASMKFVSDNRTDYQKKRDRKNFELKESEQKRLQNKEATNAIMWPLTGPVYAVQHLASPDGIVKTVGNTKAVIQNGGGPYIEKAVGSAIGDVLDATILAAPLLTQEARLARELNRNIKQGIQSGLYYHGSPNRNISMFKTGKDGGIYFTQNRDAAKLYTGTFGTGKVYNADLNLGNKTITIDNGGATWTKIPENTVAKAFSLTPLQVHDIIGSYNLGEVPWHYGFTKMFGYKPKNNYYAIDQVVKLGKDLGISSLIINNAKDNGKRLFSRTFPYDLTVVYDPRQIILGGPTPNLNHYAPLPQMSKTSPTKTSLAFYERQPAKVSEAERLGIPKGVRNLPASLRRLLGLGPYDEFADKGVFGALIGEGSESAVYLHASDPTKVLKVNVDINGTVNKGRHAAIKRYIDQRNSLGIQLPIELEGVVLSHGQYRPVFSLKKVLLLPDNLIKDYALWREYEENVLEPFLLNLGFKRKLGGSYVKSIDGKATYRIDDISPYNIGVDADGNPLLFDVHVERSDWKTGKLFKQGGSIKIKKKNRGSFTRYCNGKVTEECIRKGKNSSNPTTRKRANFAWVARHKFKHEEGGKLNYLNYFN